MDLDDLFSAKTLIPLFGLIILLLYLSAAFALSVELLPFLIIRAGGLVVGVSKGAKALRAHWDRGDFSEGEYLMLPGGLDAYEEFLQEVDQAEVPGVLPSPCEGRMSSAMLA